MALQPASRKKYIQVILRFIENYEIDNVLFLKTIGNYFIIILKACPNNLNRKKLIKKYLLL